MTKKTFSFAIVQDLLLCIIKFCFTTLLSAEFMLTSNTELQPRHIRCTVHCALWRNDYVLEADIMQMTQHNHLLS